MANRCKHEICKVIVRLEGINIDQCNNCNIYLFQPLNEPGYNGSSWWAAYEQERLIIVGSLHIEQLMKEIKGEDL